MNIFRIFQRWRRKGGNNEQNAPRVLPSTTSIPARTLEQGDNNGPANDVVHQAAIQVEDHANAAGGHGARWIGPDGAAKVAGRDIGGMVYLVPEQRQSVRVQMSRPFIDPRLPLSAVGI